MKQFKLLLAGIGLLTTHSLFAQPSQPPGGGNGPEGEYEQGKVKQRSESAHKKEDKINKHNNKAREKSNAAAEKDRKDKLSKQKKKDNDHEFKF